MASLSSRVDTTTGCIPVAPAPDQPRYAVNQVTSNYIKTTGETKMSKLRTLNLTLVDNNPNLKAAKKIVFQSLGFITEHTNDQTIQQILMSGDVAKALEKHNEKRVKVVDKEILRNTGRDVMLEEVEIFDLEWQVVQVA